MKKTPKTPTRERKTPPPPPAPLRDLELERVRGGAGNSAIDDWQTLQS